MKNKKLILLLKVSVISFIATMTMFLNNISLGATAPNPLIFGLLDLRSESDLGYSIGDPKSNGAKLWNIVKYQNEETNYFEEMNVYCLKAGVGFTTTNEKVKYDTYFDMIGEKDTIKNNNKYIKSIIEGTIELEDGQVVNRYDALLALIDMLYIKGESTEDEKTALLNSALIYPERENYLITDDEIDAVQQAAIWYFTNYDEDNIYDKTNEDSWLYFTEDGNTYQNLENYNPNQDLPSMSAGVLRQAQVTKLYKHLITTAINNANKYTQANNSNVPAEVKTQELQYKESKGNFIIGPIRIEEREGNTKSFDIEFNVKNNGEQTNEYKILDDSMQEISEDQTIKDLVGKDFYISISKDIAKKISVEIKIKYQETKMTMWMSENSEDEQPLLIPEREAKEKVTNLEVEPIAKKFDLALRKYITKINNALLLDKDSRIPEIDKQSLETGTTATYKHKKDPVEVKTGDRVTYQLTIYNEGEKAGRATKIIDQLPTGLRFNQVITGNFEVESYDELTNNTLILTRKAGNEENLEAYKGEEISSETIEIECIVTMEANINADKVLTNVAWIEEEYDADGDEIITNKVGVDIDSEPLTKPNVGKDNIENYTGNTSNKSELDDSNYYYKGEQDDDDFEKLIVKQAVGEYNIKLIKKDENNTKNLQGATFGVKIGDLKEETYETNENGEININGINITKLEKENIVIREIEAPDGYKKIIENLTIEITKEIQDGKIVVTNPKIIETNYAQNVNQKEAQLTLQENNTIQIELFNQEKEFDLALRKYITKVGNIELQNRTSREPNIDKTTIENELTATYKHRKDPVEVQTGDKVIYNITIYNEGEKPGRATKIVDQLPEGLKFSQIISGNFEVYSYNENQDNKLILTRKAENSENLPEYNNGILSSETIKIECEVTKQADNEDKTLTNVAWIEEEIDGITNEVITNQTGKDRDSEPLTKPIVDKDNMENYTGNTSNKNELNDSNYYYKGEQDDDDFEKLILKKATGDYDLKIIKVDNENQLTKLNGAKFKITFENGTQQEEVTNQEGEIKLEGIQMQEEGTETIAIEEIEAPTGYNKIFNSIELEITKEIVNGKYTITNIEITNTRRN